MLYSLPIFREYINQLRSPVKEVARKIRKLFKEIETSNALVRTSFCGRYLNLRLYEHGMQYDAHECLLQLLEKIYPNVNDECIFKIDKLESTICNDCDHAANNDGICTDWSLHSDNSSTIRRMLHQLMDSTYGC